jgi:hypothetical protein
MKKFFGPALLSGWLAGVLPEGIFKLGKKTPWYRKSWMLSAPWFGGALMAPLAIYMAWKGVSKLRSQSEQR